MSRYRICYSPEAEHGLAALGPAVRGQVKNRIADRIGRDPYGKGSDPVRGDKDLRTAAIGPFVVIHYRVHGGQLLITVVRAVAPW
ncbi:type II toxin-antitoxin system RelE/ParE family toxin [Streptomyces sp. NPDC051567]|uniref:type II toxin-antitoxin system RelE/ParE family toxin n=1 Tax=Streptomyces sp. NPDC051567 TaxID=3365660 RepID=UPI0037B16979